MSSILGRLFGSDAMDYSDDHSGASPSRRRQQTSGETDVVPRRWTDPHEENKEHKTFDAKELEELRSTYNITASQLAQVQREHKDLIQSYHGVISENHSLKNFASHAVRDLESLREWNNSLEQELQACKDDLFKLQPRNTVPDSDVGQAYDELHEHISSWMEGEISRIERVCWKSNNSALPKFFHHGGKALFKKLLVSYPASGGEYLVRYRIGMILQKTILDKGILLLGLDDATCTLLKRIERKMSEAKPSRDPESIHSWRSDTLSALSTTTDLQKSRQKAARNAGVNILEDVSQFFVIIDRTEASLRTLLDKVVEPAMKLANKIQISPATYEFLPKVEEIPPLDGFVLSVDHLSKWKLIDVTTGKTLKVDSPVEANDQGQIGTRVMVLAPALYRRDPGKDPLLLVKPIILVQLYKPMGRRRAATGPPKQQ
ncbi:MAG: hypothetical protein Q9184_007510 [Pyrenodesmia sp. 2 TL-2023]